MPEIPDLDIFSKNLQSSLKGLVLKEIKIIKGKRIKVPADELNGALAGHKLLSVYREGKQLRFSFGKDRILGMHLMLHGKLFLFKEKNEEKYTLVELYFKDGTGLAVTDFQGMASITLNPEESAAPDALSPGLDGPSLKDILATKKKDIKTVLLDQDIIRGIGNAYADDILWYAGISPFSKADQIPAEKAADLAGAIKKVLGDATTKIAASHKGIIAGEVRDYMLVHDPKKEKSPKGEPIKHTDTKTRRTYYTDGQVLYK